MKMRENKKSVDQKEIVDVIFFFPDFTKAADYYSDWIKWERK